MRRSLRQFSLLLTLILVLFGVGAIAGFCAQSAPAATTWLPPALYVGGDAGLSGTSRITSPLVGGQPSAALYVKGRLTNASSGSLSTVRQVIGATVPSLSQFMPDSRITALTQASQVAQQTGTVYKGLTCSGTKNATYAAPITVNGDLTISGSGIYTFASVYVTGNVTISNASARFSFESLRVGGALTVSGGTATQWGPTYVAGNTTLSGAGQRNMTLLVTSGSLTVSGTQTIAGDGVGSHAKPATILLIGQGKTMTYSSGGVFYGLLCNRYGSFIQSSTGIVQGSALCSGSYTGAGSVSIAYDPNVAAAILDLAAPATSASQSPAASAAGWNNGSVLITLTAQDNGWSGVAVTNYQVDGAPLPPGIYAGPFLVAGQGAHTVTCWSEDKAGNIEDPAKTITVKIDSTAPTGTVKVNGDAPWTNSRAATLSLSASDGSGAGVAQMRFSNDANWSASSWQSYATSASWTLADGDGPKTVHAQFKDNAGNVSSASVSDAVGLDTTAPTTTPDASPTPHADGWYGSAVTVSLGAEDNPGGSNVDRTMYEIDDGAVQAYSAPVRLSTDGTHTVRYWSVDEAGNAETTKSLGVKIDQARPAVSVAGDPAGWYKDPLTLTFIPTVGASGVVSVEYRADDSGWTQLLAVAGSYQLPVADEGWHIVAVRVTNGAGVTSDATTCSFGIDRNAPSVELSALNGGTTGFNRPVFTFSASDGGSGMSSGLTVEVDGNRVAATSGQPLPDALDNGDHSLSVTATDLAGNQVTTDPLTFTVDAPPFNMQPNLPSEGDVIGLYADDSSKTGNPDGSRTGKRWHWTISQDNKSAVSFYGPVGFATLPDPGTYHLSLSVTDDTTGAICEKEQAVTARPQAPWVHVLDVEAVAGQPATLGARFLDPGWNQTHEATWVIEDGTPIAGKVTEDRAATMSSGYVAGTTPPLENTGQADVELRGRLVVTDDTDQSTDVPFTITVHPSSYSNEVDETATLSDGQAHLGYVRSVGDVSLYKVTLDGQPLPYGTEVLATLRDLPADYDLAVIQDLGEGVAVNLLDGASLPSTAVHSSADAGKLFDASAWQESSNSLEGSDWDAIRANIGGGAWDAIRANIGGGDWDAIRANIGGGAWEAIRANIGGGDWDAIRANIGGGAWDAIRANIGGGDWDAIRANIGGGAWEAIRANIGGGDWDAIRANIGGGAWDAIRANIGGGTWDAIRANIGGGDWDAIRANIGGGDWDAIRANIGGGDWNVVRANIGGGDWDAIRANIGGGEWDAIRSAIRNIGDGDWEAVRDAFKDVMGDDWEAIRAATQGVEGSEWNAVGNVVQGISGSDWDVIRANIGGGAWDAFRANIGGGAWDGIRANIGGGEWDAIRANIGGGTWDAIRANIGGGAWDAIRANIGGGEWDAIRANIGGGVWDAIRANIGGGEWDAIRASIGGGDWDAIRNNIDGAEWEAILQSICNSYLAGIEQALSNTAWLGGGTATGATPFAPSAYLGTRQSDHDTGWLDMAQAARGSAWVDAGSATSRSLWVRDPLASMFFSHLAASTRDSLNGYSFQDMSFTGLGNPTSGSDMSLQELGFDADAAENMLVVGFSANRGTTPDVVWAKKQFVGGNTYIAVKGANGAHSGTASYTIQVETSVPIDTPEKLNEGVTKSPRVADPSPTVTTEFVPDPAGQPDPPETLFVTQSQRIDAIYGDPALSTYVGPEPWTRIVLPALEAACESPLVKGEVLSVPAAIYEGWDRAPWDVQQANDVTLGVRAAIRDYVYGDSFRGLPAHPSIKYVVLVGSDEVLPQHRVEDQTVLDNERDYVDSAGLKADSPLAASMFNRMVLTDDYYVDARPAPFNGRSLYIPDLAVSRLVETPAEIAGVIETFLAQDGILAAGDPAGNRAVVTGQDFMSDGAQRVSDILSAAKLGPILEPLDTWGADDVRRDLLAAGRPVGDVNAHFTHFGGISARGWNLDRRHLDWTGEFLSSTDIVSAPSFTGGLVFSMGCHAGLSVPDDQIAIRVKPGATMDPALDVAQAVAQRRGVLIASTGYGYGDTEAIAGTEALIGDFADQATTAEAISGPAQPIGLALAAAKRQYCGSISAFTPYDEKSSLQFAMYGMPQYRLACTTHPAVTGQEAASVVNPGAAGWEPWHPTLDQPQPPGTFTLTVLDGNKEPATYTAELRGWSAYSGTVFTANGDAQATPDRPIQPRMVVDLGSGGPNPAKAALIVGGSYVDISRFDPAISRWTTEWEAYPGEFQVASDGWWPANPVIVRTITGADLADTEQRLVVLPGQFLSTSADGQRIKGTERLWDSLTVRLVRGPVPTETSDTVAPTVRSVALSNDGTTWTATIDARDAGSGMARIDVTQIGAGDATHFAFTVAQGAMGPYDLQFSLPDLVTRDVSIRVDVIDRAGNVTSETAKGMLFTSPPEGTVTLNGGAEKTFSPLVSVDSDVVHASQMRTSVDGKATWTPWQRYASRLLVPLPGLPGDKIVWAQYRGDASASLELSASIRLARSTIAAGTLDSFALLGDGGLWAWGSNTYGLGDGSSTIADLPVGISSGVEWMEVAAGQEDTLALKSDGSLWAWGRNAYGQHGDGTQAAHTEPAPINAGTDWIAVVIGRYGDYSLGLKSDGSLWAWGLNAYGDFGNGTTISSMTPTRVDGTNWIAVDAGVHHTLALKSDGSLWAWGWNAHGQLGDETTTDRSSPVQIGGGNTWTAIAAGDDYSLAIKTDGTLWAWGNNDFGKLGDGTRIERHVPVQIGSDTDWTAAVASTSHSLALKADGTLWAWGDNAVGALGDGTSTERHEPIRVGSRSDWAAADAGGFHSLGLTTDGTVWSWGSNWYAQLGSGTTDAGRAEPAPVGGLVDFVPPVTTATLDRLPNAAGWSDSFVTVSLAAADNVGGSSVATTYFSVDSGFAQIYSIPFMLSGDGSHTVSYWSTDAAGNGESHKTLTVKIDTTTPTANIVSPAHGATVADATPQLVFNVSDDHLAHVIVRVDGVIVETNSGDNLDALSVGLHSITVTATDRAGNLAQALSTFTISTANPSTELASPGAPQEAIGASLNPACSADGRYVAFSSDAANLVTGDTNASRDVFVYDRQTGVTEGVSCGNGNQADGQSDTPSISADGRYVAFTSDATNLVASDANGKADVFVYDRQTHVTERRQRRQRAARRPMATVGRTGAPSAPTARWSLSARKPRTSSPVTRTRSPMSSCMTVRLEARSGRAWSGMTPPRTRPSTQVSTRSRSPCRVGLLTIKTSTPTLLSSAREACTRPTHGRSTPTRGRS